LFARLQEQLSQLFSSWSGRDVGRHAHYQYYYQFPQADFGKSHYLFGNLDRRQDGQTAITPLFPVGSNRNLPSFKITYVADSPANYVISLVGCPLLIWRFNALLSRQQTDI
jgi:hypothetical protein